VAVKFRAGVWNDTDAVAKNEGVAPTHEHARLGCGLVLFLSRDLRFGKHPGDLRHACVSLIPRQAAMANVKRLARKEKTVVLVWLKIYLIRLLPFPAAESTAQRCKNAHRRYPVRQRLVSAVSTGELGPYMMRRPSSPGQLRR
jgi:hypothetical protein